MTPKKLSEKQLSLVVGGKIDWGDVAANCIAYGVASMLFTGFVGGCVSSATAVIIDGLAH